MKKKTAEYEPSSSISLTGMPRSLASNSNSFSFGKKPGLSSSSDWYLLPHPGQHPLGTDICFASFPFRDEQLQKRLFEIRGHEVGFDLRRRCLTVTREDDAATKIHVWFVRLALATPSIVAKNIKPISRSERQSWFSTGYTDRDAPGSMSSPFRFC